MVDRTDLAGVFDVELRFALTAEQPGNNEPSWAADVTPGLSAHAALKDQLGLVMTQVRGSVEFFVVESLEMPSAD